RRDAAQVLPCGGRCRRSRGRSLGLRSSLVGRRRSGLGSSGRGAAAVLLVLVEERPPGLVDRVLIWLVLLIQFLDQPLVGPEVFNGAVRRIDGHGADRLLPDSRLA